MISDATFNSDLFTAEHLMIEDEAASTQLSVRRQFGSMLKNMIVNEHQSLHRKGRDALMVSPFWRVSITVNDEPENLMVLPPIDESLRDKITLLKAFVPEFPYTVDNMEGRRQFRTQLSAELPAFLRYLQTYKIPAASANQRYGVAAFQDAELMQELEELSPEYKLLAIIDRLQIWGVDRALERLGNRVGGLALGERQAAVCGKIAQFQHRLRNIPYTAKSQIPGTVQTDAHGKTWTGMGNQAPRYVILLTHTFLRQLVNSASPCHLSR